MKRISFIAAILVLSAGWSFALTIYPLDRAQILAGARFDFKVELDAVAAEGDVSIMVERAGTASDASKAFGRKPAYMAQDADVNASAFVLRDLTLPVAGTYKVTVKDSLKSKTVTWTVYPAAAKATAKNVIFLLADGLSVGIRTAARIMSKGNTEGTSNGLMNFDLMERTGMVGTSSVDSIAVDSANSMSAYMTGHKSSVNAMGVYADRTKDPFDDPGQETIGELIRRTTGKSIGIVSDAGTTEDATPATVVSHTRRRDEKAAIVKFFLDVKPEVILGGGAAYFLPKSVQGSKRADEMNYIDEFQKAGYALATTNTELSQVMSGKPKRVLGLFHPSNMDGVMDRKIFLGNTVADYPDQPDLTDMTKAALEVLSKNPQGFFLMVEAGLIDKFEHPMDWERAAYDTIMYDKVVGIAQDFAKKNPGTLVVVTGDHTHSISVFGTVDDNIKFGQPLRERVGVYAGAGFPSYADADNDGYPDTPAVPKRLAVGWGNHPDYWETFIPKLDNTFAPTVKDEKGNYIANEKYKNDDAVLIAGNLPHSEATEVHSVDDMTLSMSGPGAEKLKAYQENTAIFRYMVEALGLAPKGR